MKTFLRILVVSVALAAGGCVETRFESPLGDNIETCDAGWKGLWVVAEERKDQAKDASAFYVNDECQFIVIDQPEKGGPLKQIHVPVNYVHADRKDYIVVADTAIRGLVELKPPHGVKPAPEKTFFYARYRLHGDRIDLFQVDSDKTAKLVLDGKAGGTVDKSQNELHVYVTGSRGEMLDLVKSQDIFEKSPLRLVRSKETLDEFEKSVLRSGAAR
ncbi:MAG TPA: hypothetical protein VI258_12105 [Rhodanobacteraceae bacterium]